MTKPTLVMHERESDYNGLVNLGNRVFAALTGNLSYTTPAIPLLTIQTNVTDVINALALWGDVHNRGRHSDLVNLKAKALILHNNLRAELNYCETTAVAASPSDYSVMATILGTSGFDMKGAKTPQGVLEAVQGLQQVVSPELNRNQAKIEWSIPNNVTSAGNVFSYDLYIADTNDFTAATHLASTKPTVYVYTNASAAPVNKFIWVVPLGAAGEGARSNALPISILGI